MKGKILCCSTALAIGMSPIAQSESSKPSILQIFDQFVMASKAASSCIKPEKDQLQSFLRNFRAVSQRAAEEIKAKKPDWSEKKIAAIMKKRGNDLSDKVGEVIDKNGCVDDRIKDLLKRFKVQAGLNFG